MLLTDVSSVIDELSELDKNPLVAANMKVESTEGPERPAFREPAVASTEERLDDVTEGSGSGIRIESSTAPPSRAVSAVQLFSFTNTGFDLCQQRLVTA